MKTKKIMLANLLLMMVLGLALGMPSMALAGKDHHRYEQSMHFLKQAQKSKFTFMIKWSTYQWLKMRLIAKAYFINPTGEIQAKKTVRHC